MSLLILFLDSFFMARCGFLWQYCLPPATRITRAGEDLAVGVGSLGTRTIEELAFFRVLDLILRGIILGTVIGFRMAAMMNDLSLR